MKHPFSNEEEYSIDDRWNSEDFISLNELWTEKYKIEEISQTLDKSLFSTIKTIAWKQSPKLSDAVDATDIGSIKELVTQIYLSDYPDLVDSEITIKERTKAINKIKVEKNKKLDNFNRIISSIEDIQTNKELSGLEQIVQALYYQNESISNTNPKDIRERLIWISALSNLLSDLEFTVFFSVFPANGGPKLTYSDASKEIGLPTYKVSVAARNCLKKYTSWINSIGKKVEDYSGWIILTKDTYLSMGFKNRNFELPSVEINYENLPQKIRPLEEFEFTKTAIDRFNKAGFFCIGDFQNTSYEELRLNHSIPSHDASNIFNIYQNLSNEI